MKKITVAVTQRRCAVEEFLCLAETGAGASAWVLLETAKKAGLMRLADCRAENRAVGASRIIVFSGSGEYRMEKGLSEQQGWVREVLTGTEQGKECRMREQEYLLRGDAGARGRLLCREFFCPDANGMLKSYCECLAGIKED